MASARMLAPAVLRISLALVFLSFGFMQVKSPDDWVGFVPAFLTTWSLTANNFVMLNAFVELTLGMFMLLGLYLRFSSFILALHLFGITFSLGIGPLAVRDFGLAFATLAVFLYGLDAWCVDAKWTKKSVLSTNS
jgi:uncharacterized membrane protein YphA (DoxX/SURF4 family)